MDVYKEVDTDGDGFLDKDELANMMNAIGVAKERGAALFDLADHDGSGSIDFEEFCTWIFSDAKQVMSVCVKKGELIKKHLKMEMQTGDVLCYGVHELSGSEGYRYELSIQPDEETVRSLEQVAKNYAEAKAKEKVEALTKAETDAKAKLDALVSKAEAKAKAKADPKAKPDPKAEEKERADEEARTQAEEAFQAATAAKEEAQAKPLEIEPVVMLQNVSQSLVENGDEESSSSGAHVCKFKANEAGTALVKVLQHYRSPEGAEGELVDKVSKHDFTVTVVPLPEGEKPKPDWFAWSWQDVKWIKAPANKADKFAKKMGQDAKDLEWVPEVYAPKKEKLHVQSTFCFGPKLVAEE